MRRNGQLPLNGRKEGKEGGGWEEGGGGQGRCGAIFRAYGGLTKKGDSGGERDDKQGRSYWSNRKKEIGLDK